MRDRAARSTRPRQRADWQPLREFLAGSTDERQTHHPAAAWRSGRERVDGDLGPGARRGRADEPAGGRGRHRGPARPAAGSLGRDGSHDRPRDQEPADADPPLHRAHGRGPRAPAREFEEVFDRCSTQHPAPGRRAAADRQRVLDLQPHPEDPTDSRTIWSPPTTRSSTAIVPRLPPGSDCARLTRPRLCR